MFVAGGLAYTELCRNVIYFDDSNSRQVLDVFDRLIMNTTGNSLAVFDTYITCADNESLYTAFKVSVGPALKFDAFDCSVAVYRTWG